DAGAALDAGDRLRDVDHRLRRHDPLALGRLTVVEQPRGDAPDLLPVRRLHVGDEVLDHRHVAHRLDHDRLLTLGVGLVGGPVRALVRLADLRQAGQGRLAVDLDAAGATDGGATGAAHSERAVLAVSGL